MPEGVNPYDIYMGPSSEESPGGFVFGPQGWIWGAPRPKCITFFLDGTAKVSDQFGRPIKGVKLANSNINVMFAQGPPSQEDSQTPTARKEYATHAQVIAALEAEKIDWKSLTMAGFPQLPYEELKKLPVLPPTPIRELRKITDPKLRADAIRACREATEARKKEIRGDSEEEYEE